MSEWLKKGWAVLLAATLLVGCGGSGSSSDDDDGTGGGTTPTPTAGLTVVIYDPSGTPTTSVTSSAPGTVRATLLADGAPVANSVVTFTTTLGTLDPVSGTALTNASGVAQVTLNAGTVAGAGTVTATATSGTSTVNGTANFSTQISANNITLAVSTPAVNVSAGGTTTITATLTNGDGSPFATSVPVTFTSACSTQARATISSPVNSSSATGTATATYLAQGCVGADIVNVSVNAGGTVLTGTATVNVQAASLGSISFTSASPTNIALLGTGDATRPETSTLIFRVLDSQGNPLSNIVVTFSLDTDVGGITVSPISAQTDSNGNAQTVVNAGTVATSVRVTAVATQGSNSFSTTSSRLVISTGLPDQDSFSLSASEFNPEAWEIDGAEVTITARMADAFNNPPPVGTTVQFRTEGGSIEPSCTTDATGACSVIWRSQASRPVGSTIGTGGCVIGTSPCAQPYGGRVTILATAIGTESFPDSNPSNGRLDLAEQTAFLTGQDVQGRDFDVPEAFRDDNEDGGFQIAGDTSDSNEVYVDFNNDFTYNAKDGMYNGVLCSQDATICANGTTVKKTMHVRDSLVLIMSSNDIRAQASAASICVANSSVATINVMIADFHNQPIPVGSDIDFTTTNGSIAAGSSYEMPNTNDNGASVFAVAVKGNTDTTASGTLFVTITTPAGIERTIALTTVDDIAGQGTCP